MDIERAAAEIESSFGPDKVRLVPDDQGGTWVEITGLDPGEPYDQVDTFLICLLPFNLPGADVYPMFVRADLTRTDKRALGEGFQSTQLKWAGDPEPRPVVQISRRTKGDFAVQTPLQKIDKVLAWLRSR